MSQKKSNQIAELPEVVELFDAIAMLYPSANGFNGVIVRSVGIKYATTKDFFSGIGAALCGGRWNRKGLEAIYASLDVITATYEANQNFIAYGFPLSAIQPRVTAGANVSLGRVLDLTNPKVCESLGFFISDLISEDWQGLQKSGVESWTQAIGRGCATAGFEGIIVPSAQNKGGKNIVIFPNNLAKSSSIKILAADQLPT